MDTSDKGLHVRMSLIEKNLGSQIVEVTSDLASLKKRVEDNESGLDQRIETAITRFARRGPGDRQRLSLADQSRVSNGNSLRTSGPTTKAADSYKEERDWRARRSLRMWPIPGPDHSASLRKFLADSLGLEEAFTREVDAYQVRPVRSTKSKIPHEATVLFPDVETRDSVRSAASNLAGNAGAGQWGYL